MKCALAPMDYYFFRPNLYTIQFVFEYKGRIDVTKLQLALKEVSELFRPIKYKIERVSDMTLQFVEDDLPVPLTFIELDHRPDEVDNLIDPVTNLPGNPLFKIKLSFYKNQTFVGISFSHMLGDGFSFLMLMKAITKVMTNSSPEEIPNLNRTPHYERNMKNDFKGSMERLFEKTGYVTPRPPTPMGSKLEIIIVTYEEIQKLKSETIKKISSNSFIMAILIKKYHSKIPLTVNGKLIVRCPVDYRKLHSKVPSNYFGNAVKDAVTVFDPEEFVNMSLVQVAGQIQDSIEAVDEKSVHDSLEALDHLRVEHTASIFNNLGCPGLLVTNISRFPFDDINFGTGRPSGIHHASQNPRLAVVMPHSSGFEIRIKI